MFFSVSVHYGDSRLRLYRVEAEDENEAEAVALKHANNLFYVSCEDSESGYGDDEYDDELLAGEVG